MLFNFDFIIVVLALTIFGALFTYTFYIIFTTLYKPSNVGLYKKFKLSLIRLASIGTVSTKIQSQTTVVHLSDEELNQLLEVVFREIGTSNEISAALLQSLGLYTSTVVSYLEALGYIIIS